MNGKLLYFDSSAIVKFVALERESSALFEFAKSWPERVSSQLARVEVLRALRRGGGSAALRRRAEDVLGRMALIRVDDAVIAAAAEIGPSDLRTLDSLHLATALSLGTQLGILVAYDRRLIEAARIAGVETASPS
ncbi:MAG TPA: type II toxin-antitoxin system VapC family toxin [Thermoanaerobaculia bacterium]|nr:type II toxin-antitoxin system VapC family toxin [Thermoanaerobaculia bacterium]